MHYAWKLLIKIFFNRLLITWINKVRGSASRIITWRKDWSPPNLLANYTINLWKIITVAHLYCHLVETIYFLKIYPLLFQRKSHEFSQLCAMTCAVSPASQLSRSCTCLWVLHTPVRPLLCPGRRARGRRRGSTAGQDGSALGPPQMKALPRPQRSILTQFTGGKWTYGLECIVEGWKKSFPPLWQSNNKCRTSHKVMTLLESIRELRLQDKQLVWKLRTDRPIQGEGKYCLTWGRCSQIPLRI